MIIPELTKRLKMNNSECSIDESSSVSNKQHRAFEKIQTFAEANRVEFDYSEGEGEIKAINWLTNYKDHQRLILAKDNDVFIYVLSKYINCTSEREIPVVDSSTTITSSKMSMIPLKDSQNWTVNMHDDSSLDVIQVIKDANSNVLSWRNSTFDNSVSALCENTNDLFVFHESSNVLHATCCWHHLNHHYNKCWLLLLWFGVCFGNDFAFGILNKSVSTMIHYYMLLERHLLTINQNVVSYLRTRRYDRRYRVIGHFNVRYRQ